MRYVYVIERLLVNPEYQFGENAFMYIVDGYATNEEKAMEITNGSKTFKKGQHPWLPHDLPEYRYQKARSVVRR